MGLHKLHTQEFFPRNFTGNEVFRIVVSSDLGDIPYIKY